jgi:hypothetical protein
VALGEGDVAAASAAFALVRELGESVDGIATRLGVGSEPDVRRDDAESSARATVYRLLVRGMQGATAALDAPRGDAGRVNIARYLFWE